MSETQRCVCGYLLNEQGLCDLCATRQRLGYRFCLDCRAEKSLIEFGDSVSQCNACRAGSDPDEPTTTERRLTRRLADQRKAVRETTRRLIVAFRREIIQPPNESSLSTRYRIERYDPSTKEWASRQGNAFRDLNVAIAKAQRLALDVRIADDNGRIVWSSDAAAKKGTAQ